MAETNWRELCRKLVQHAATAQRVLVGEGLWDGDEDDGLLERARAAIEADELAVIEHIIGADVVTARIESNDGRLVTVSEVARLSAALSLPPRSNCLPHKPMTTPINHPPTRAQRLVDEFTEGATSDGGFKVRRGLAWVLRHLADNECEYGYDETLPYVPARTLETLADALEAPTLLDRAMAGDAAAARQFLYEAGFTDMRGQWLPQYQTPQETE